MPQRVTFTCRDTSPRTQPRVTDFRCNETGVHYQLETVRAGYIIRNSGHAEAFRIHRDEAVDYIEQLANLDFLTAQAESAYFWGDA